VPQFYLRLPLKGRKFRIATFLMRPAASPTKVLAFSGHFCSPEVEGKLKRKGLCSKSRGLLYYIFSDAKRYRPLRV
jgi:hypothetical protein